MAAPNLEIDDFLHLVAGISNPGIIKKGGQKAVLPCDFQGDRIVVKALELNVPYTSSFEDDLSIEIDDVFARAKRELLILERCNTNHIVKLGPIRPFNTEYNTKHFFIFSEEFVNGDDLESELNGNVLAPSEIVKIGTHILSALETLQSLNTLHRDIKPQNIMRRNSTGDYLLLDMGVAFDINSASLTSTGFVVGSRPYLSPERIDFMRKRDVDIRSDFFCLGIVLYQAATRLHPFYNSSVRSEAELISNILSVNPTPPSDINPSIPIALSNVILRVLEKKPHMRYRNTVVFKDALLNSLK